MRRKKENKMRKRRRSVELVFGLGLTLLIALTMTVWTMERADENSPRQAPSPESRSQTVANETHEVESTEVVNQVQIPSSVTTPPISEEAPVLASPNLAGMQLDQVMAGDFSSMEGLWVNGDGNTLRFDSRGLIDGAGQIQGLKASSNGTARGYLAAAEFGGVSLELLPAGSIFSDYTYYREDQETVAFDASDKEQDRIWLGQDFSQIAEASTYYYRSN